MNRFVPIGLGVAAVAGVLVVGTQLAGRPAPGGVGAAPPATITPSAAPPSTATEPPSPSPTGYGLAFLPVGPFAVIDPTPQSIATDPYRITVTIPATGWVHLADFGGLGKGEDADPPEAGMLFASTPTGTDYYVYGDPCKWKSTIPDTPARTVDEIVSALAAQASRDASVPTEVTVGGHPGKHITLHVPDGAATRGEAFADCDENNFASFAIGGSGLEPSRWHQGPGQVDELWVLDVDGATVIIDAMYRPNTPQAYIDEMRSIAQSATFEVP